MMTESRNCRPKENTRPSSSDFLSLFRGLCSNKTTPLTTQNILYENNTEGNSGNNLVETLVSTDIKSPGKSEALGHLSEHSVDDYGFVAWQQGKLERRIVEMKQLSWQQRNAGTRGCFMGHDGGDVMDKRRNGKQPKCVPWYQEPDFYDDPERIITTRSPHSLFRSASFRYPERRREVGHMLSSSDPARRISGNYVTGSTQTTTTNRRKGCDVNVYQNLPRRNRKDDVIDYPENAVMVIVDGFDPSSELSGLVKTGVSVRRGEIVQVTAQCGDWLLVKTFDGETGHVPLWCAAPAQVVVNPTPKRDFSQQFPETTIDPESPVWSRSHMIDTDLGFESVGSVSPSAHSDSAEETGLAKVGHPVKRSRTHSGCCTSDPAAEDRVSGLRHQLTVLFDYAAKHADDVTVRHGDVVLLLDDKDDSWCLVKTDAGVEGYIPKSYTIDLSVFNLEPDAKTTYL